MLYYHSRPARRVNVYYPDARVRRCGDRSGRGVGNIMNFRSQPYQTHVAGDPERAADPNSVNIFCPLLSDNQQDDFIDKRRGFIVHGNPTPQRQVIQ